MGENTRESEGAMRRRTVVKGAAWAAPVITVGAAAPAEAASAPAEAARPAPITSSVSWTCKEAWGNSWRYTVSLTFSNGLRDATFVRVANFKVSVGGRVVVSGSSTINVPAGESRTVYFTSDPTRQSGTGTGAVTYTYRDCAGATRPESRAVQLTALSSCGGEKDRDKDHERASVGTTPEATPAKSSPTTGTAPTPEATPTKGSPATGTAPSPEATPTKGSSATGLAPSPASAPATAATD